jgi:hypothetical protein
MSEVDLECLKRLEAACKDDQSFTVHEYRVYAQYLVEQAPAIISEIEALRKNNQEWIAANGPGGWIDELRRDRARLTEVERRAKVKRQVKGGIKVLHLGYWQVDERGLRAAIDASIPQPAPEVAHCPICDWPMTDSVKEGCVPGNCSYRPEPGSESYRRIQERRAQLRVDKLTPEVKP